MSSLFEYVPHPHIERREALGPPTIAAALIKVHGPGRIGRLNAKVGLKITVVVGTMWCAYLFTVVALISAPKAFGSHDRIIIVGQNVQATAADARSQATYDDAAAVLAASKQIHAHLAAQDEAISKILATLAPSG
jgi:hypothetical protein